MRQGSLVPPTDVKSSCRAARLLRVLLPFRCLRRPSHGRRNPEESVTSPTADCHSGANRAQRSCRGDVPAPAGRQVLAQTSPASWRRLFVRGIGGYSYLVDPIKIGLAAASAHPTVSARRISGIESLE